MLKKLIAIGIATAITMTTLIGCSSSTNSDSKTTESAKESTDTKKDIKDEVVTLKYYAIGSEPPDRQMVEDKINEYTREKIGVEIDYNFITPGEYTQKTSLMINTGDDFDLMFTCSWAGDYSGNANKGGFLDLTPYLDTIGKDMYDAIDPRFWEGAKINGKVYAVPNQKEIAAMPMWIFAKDLVEKYDIPYKDIKTLQDLEPYLQVIKENEPGIVPFYGRPPQYYDRIDLRLGLEIKEDGTIPKLEVRNLWEMDKFVQDLDTLRDYYKKGYLPKDYMQDPKERGEKVFVSIAHGQPYAENIWSKEKGYEVVATQAMDAVITNLSATGSMIGISANTKYPEKSVEFLNLLNTDPYLRNLINYGIEGVHYEKIGENQIKLIENNYKGYEVTYSFMGNLFITDVLDTDPLDKWDTFKEFNDNAIVSPILGFSMNLDNISNEISALTNVTDEFEPILYSGSVDPKEYLKKANDKLYQQGLQKVIDEAQAQLDAWLEQK